MGNLVLVMAGGAFGAGARYLTGAAVGRVAGTGWPWGTLTINVAGGLLMGVLVSALAHRGGADSEKWRAALGVGVLGGFTTFSAYTLETALMIERRQYLSAASYVAASTTFALAALFAGLILTRKVLA